MAYGRRFRKVTHCIFDNDGTVMDTENLYLTAFQRAMEPFGKVFTFDMKLDYMGMRAKEVCAKLVADHNLPVTAEELDRIQLAHSMQLLDHVQLMPGAENLLLHLHKHRIPIAMATSSSRKMFNIKSRAHLNLLPVFHHIVWGCDPDIKNGKPAADIFLLAAARFQPPACPECCLVFEDSPNGVLAGRNAGMQVVMLPDPRVPAEMRKDATQVLPSMLDFEPMDFGLPPYDTCSTFELG